MITMPLIPSNSTTEFNSSNSQSEIQSGKLLEKFINISTKTNNTTTMIIFDVGFIFSLSKSTL